MLSVLGFIFSVLSCSLAFAMGGLNPSCAAWPAAGQPAPAAAQNFNCLRIYDNFRSLSTIDVNNTQTGLYTWRTATDAIGNNHMVSTDISLAPGGGVTIRDTPNTLFPGLFSAFSPNNDGVMVGKTFPNGGYFEASMAFDVTKALAACTGSSWPAFVFTLYSGFQLAEAPFTELDFYEAYPTGDGTINNHFAVDYFPGPGIGSFISAINSSNAAFPGSPNLNQQHRYGTLWVTKAQNGGTGLIERYFDGVHMDGTGGSTNQDVTYTATGGATPGPSTPAGIFSDLDGEANNLALYTGCGPSWPNTYASVQAWTP